MSNLQKFTKAQLKDELISLGVKLPAGNHLKSVYVDLYNLATDKMEKQQFSSDEEVAEVRSSSRKNQSLTGDLSTILELAEHREVKAFVNIKRLDQKSTRLPLYKHAENKIARSRDEEESLDDLNNNEIAARLKSLGVSVGPIGRTTRKLYLKKLKDRLKMESQKNETAFYSDASKEEEEEEEEEEEVEIPPVHETRSSTRRRTTNFVGNIPVVHHTRSEGGKTRSKTTTKETFFASQTTAESIRPRRPLHKHAGDNVKFTETDSFNKDEITKTEEKIETPTVVKVVAKPERHWIPVWVQVIITALVVFFIYLVFQAMEGNPGKLFLPSKN